MLETYKVGVTLDLTSNVSAALDKMMPEMERFNGLIKESSRALSGLRMDFKALGDAAGGVGRLSAAMDKLGSVKGMEGMAGDMDRMAEATGTVTAAAERLGEVLRENTRLAEAAARATETGARGGGGAGGNAGGGGGRRDGSGGHGGGHDLVGLGIGTAMVGAPVVAGAQGALERAFSVEHLRTQILADRRVTTAQADAAVNAAYAAATSAPGTRVTENLEALIDLKNVTGSLDEAEAMLPKFAQLSALLRVMDQRSGGSGDPAYASAKAMEIMGQMISETVDPKTGAVSRAIDPAMLTQHLAAMARVAVATNMRVAPNDYLNFAKNARVAGMMLSDEFTYEELPSWIQTTGGKRVGTALMSMAQVFSGGKLTDKSYDAMAAIGLAGTATTTMERDPRTGRMHRVRHDPGVYDLDLMRSDPLKYMEAAQKRMDAAGIHGTDAQLVALMKASQRSTIAGALAELLKDMPSILKEQANIRATDPDAFMHFAGQDPEAKVQQFQAALDKLSTTLGSSAMGDAVKLMDATTTALNRLSDWAKANPNPARAIFDLAAGLGTLAVAFGSIAVAIGLLAPGLRLLGIGGRAAAGAAAAGTAGEVVGVAAAGDSALAGVLAGVILPAAVAGVVGSNYETPETEAAQAKLARQRRSEAGGPNGPTYDGYGPDGQPVPSGPAAVPQVNLRGDVYLDKDKVGQIVAGSAADALSRPPAGPSTGDVRMNLHMPGLVQAPGL